MPLDCTGEILPRGISIIQPGDVLNDLDDFCLVLNIEDQVLFYECISEGLKYWVILEADDYPILVCELEQYADFLARRGQWQGRRADYLVIGSHGGDCFLIVVELRHVLVKADQEEDKFQQLRETIEHLLRFHLGEIQGSDGLAGVYAAPESYRVIGVVIAPGNTRQFSRRALNPIMNIADHQVVIRTLPKDALSDCKITWTGLLEWLGVPRGY
ncbi:hypothetical protein VB712_14795 [Spirulina sp. CCNP1310]|uniref:hypothetical protein n=1 Tax=Spirulina sp. CCNP1310 TaxID=3110249 RepID=UPI002B21BDDD|nr:hypothetical protein [Spirulina sp. CCNP1310]MEA5420498.1 hypothetical protein [Spirulina sp. CCNP1310]